MDGVTEMFRKIGDGLRRFMAGRYGSDRLNQCLLGAALVLILISRNPKWIALNVPASLGKTFHPRN